MPNSTDLPSYINVALNGSATATSVGHGGIAERVIDGNTDGNWNGCVDITYFRTTSDGST